MKTPMKKLPPVIDPDAATEALEPLPVAKKKAPPVKKKGPPSVMSPAMQSVSNALLSAKPTSKKPAAY